MPEDKSDNDSAYVRDLRAKGDASKAGGKGCAGCLVVIVGIGLVAWFASSIGGDSGSTTKLGDRSTCAEFLNASSTTQIHYAQEWYQSNEGERIGVVRGSDAMSFMGKHCEENPNDDIGSPMKAFAAANG